ncbi:FAD binding domain-containing protein [Georgfuchsia toluolica]|uniref:FAD binding domain-containing protein n=1 Tax=Georgfuchsia toluolica TaxID=424218 RepID=UPI001C72E6FE|nr:FAD binding domain-containing protein [Georgfuchsia toluolica]
MFPAQIEAYEAPDSISGALHALAGAADGMTMCLAGGMSLMQAIKGRMVQPMGIVDLQRIAALRGIRNSPQGMSVGPMTRYAELANATELSGAYGALSDAAAHVGDRQVRNRGTIGGSLCWNYISSCTPAAALAVGVTLELASLNPDGKPTSRLLSIDDFLLGPLETARRPEELLVSILLPTSKDWCGSAYKKWGPTTDAVPTIGVAVSLILNRVGKCCSARIALAGLSSGAIRFPSAEKLIVGCEGPDAKSVNAAFNSIAQNAQVEGDPWASEDYKRFLIRKLGEEVTNTAISRANPGVK